MNKQYHYVSVARRTKVVEIGIMDDELEMFHLLRINLIDNYKNFGIAVSTPDNKNFCKIVDASKDHVTKSFVFENIKYMIEVLKGINYIIIKVYTLVKIKEPYSRDCN